MKKILVENLKEGTGGFIIGMILGAALGIILALSAGDQRWENKIIEHGYGLYCPNTGYFAFNDECDS